ncbi:MAG: hypothetical protein R3314_08495 [Longimicrobiales bacterium]|nr:hypothetical protein [Longimicrobiales bacterium]
MGDVVYTSKVRIEKLEGADRDAWVPGRDEPVRFGIHSGIADHYGREVDEEHTATLDYVVAAAAG